MRRQRYDFTMTMTTTFLAYLNRVQIEHDRLAGRIIKLIQKELGGKPGWVKDCKTGRFREFPK